MFYNNLKTVNGGKKHTKKRIFKALNKDWFLKKCLFFLKMQAKSNFLP